MGRRGRSRTSAEKSRLCKRLHFCLSIDSSGAESGSSGTSAEKMRPCKSLHLTYVFPFTVAGRRAGVAGRVPRRRAFVKAFTSTSNWQINILSETLPRKFTEVSADFLWTRDIDRWKPALRVIIVKAPLHFSFSFRLFHFPPPKQLKTRLLL